MKTSYHFAENPETKQTVFIFGFGDELFIAYDCKAPWQNGDLPVEVEKGFYDKLCADLQIQEPKTTQAIAFELLRRRAFPRCPGCGKPMEFTGSNGAWLCSNRECGWYIPSPLPPELPD